MAKLILTIILFTTLRFAEAQQVQILKVGQPCPDFHLNDVAYYHKKSISFGEYKGKWLVLDFWNRFCEVCLNRMPGTDSLQKEFKQLNIMMVGYTGSQYLHRSDDKAIHNLYDKLRPRLKIDLPTAFDSVLFHRFAVGPCPYIIVVDPKGVVRGITTRLTKQAIMDLLSGREPALEKAFNKNGK